MKNCSLSRPTSSQPTVESTSSNPSPKKVTPSPPLDKLNSGSTSKTKDPSTPRSSPNHSPSPTITESNKSTVDPSIGSVDSKLTEPSTTTSGKSVLKCSMPLENGHSTTSSNSAKTTETSSGSTRPTSPTKTGSSTDTTQSICQKKQSAAQPGSSLGKTKLKQTKISQQDLNSTDGQMSTN